MAAGVSLIERKQRQARRRIVAAADELFASHGFDAVSVTDIAERAEVGRTTFFRYFGDKQEVAFAREHELLDLLAAERADLRGSDPGVLRDAVRALEPVLLRLLEHMTSDHDGYRRHQRLIESHPDLAARDAIKMQGIAPRLRELLTAQDCPDVTATLAAEVAMACYRAARRTSPHPAELVGATRRAFRDILDLGPRA